MEMIATQTTTVTAEWNGTPGFVNSPVLARAGARPDELPHLSIRVLETLQERETIAHLRQYADFRSEYELDPGMADFEAVKDELGIVMAISLGGEAIATIRFIPTGHGVTLTERFWRDLIEEPGILGSTSWEVGRLVMAPENRRADLLPRCMALALATLVNLVDVEHMHASCLTSMTRLYRRFGFRTHAVRSKHDKHCALIHGRLQDVATALKVPMPDLPTQAIAEVHLLQ
jgi:predicted GNAT family N-acyltransferase